MKATELLGLPLRHAVDQEIRGEVTDILFDLSLKEVGFILADITTDRGTAPVLFSPVVLALEKEGLTTTAHPDDIVARHDASLNRTEVQIDPANLPSTLIGPFGNTFSLSMIAALFNARIGGTTPEVADQQDGIWMSELKGHAVRAHVADVAEVVDVLLDESFTRMQQVLVKTSTDALATFPVNIFTATRNPSGQLDLTVAQQI